jgi:hypothetical protein
MRAAVLLALVTVGLCASPAVGASREPARQPPTRLWKAFPLETPRASTPVSPAQANARPPSHATASAPGGPRDDSGGVPPALVAGLLLALAAATIVVLRLTGAGAVVLARGRGIPRRSSTPESRPAPARVGRRPTLARPTATRPTSGQMRRRIRRAPSLSADLTERLQTYKGASEPAPLHLEVPPAPQHSPPAARDIGEGLCEVGVWHGYTRSQFYVWAGPDADRALEISGSFRSRADEPEQSPEAAAALEELLARLEPDWEIVAEGPRWFDRRLRRAHVAQVARPTRPTPEQGADPGPPDD